MPGSALARRTTGYTTPSGSDSRATSRCSGSIRWWSLERASRWAVASASAARWVKLLTSMVVPFLGLLVSGWVLVADDRRGVRDQVAAGGAAGLVELQPVGAGLGPQLALEGGHGGLEALDLLGQGDDPPHPFQVHAVAGEPLDLQQPLDVALGVAAGVGGGPLGPDQPLALVDPQGLGVDAGQLGRDRDDEHCPVGLRWHGRPPPAQSMPRWFLGVVSDSDANSRSRSRSLRESFSGTATWRLTSRSPAPLRPAPGTPRPRTRQVRPFWVPAGTLRVTGPSRVGTLSSVPRAASAKVTGTVMVRSWPLRPNSGWGVTRTLTIRSPAGAPAWPGSPWPLSRTVAPSLTPTGIRTRSSRVRISLPRPLQVGQGSSITEPRPRQVGQGLDSPNRPWSRVTVPRPLQVGQGRGRVPGLAPEPWQV